MDARGWRTSLIAPARTLAGRSTQVVVGLLDTAGGAQLVMRIGDGDPVILPTQAASELITHIRAAVTEKLKIEGGGAQ